MDTKSRAAELPATGTPGSRAPVLVSNFKVIRREIADGKVPLRKLFGIDRLPFAPARVEFELKGVPTAVSNALRRAMTDEMPGYRLQVAEGGFDFAQTTDPFALAPFVRTRIEAIPLAARIPPKDAAGHKYTLDVSNPSLLPLPVYSGDLRPVDGKQLGTPLLFNPTFRICVLRPGKRIVVRNIGIGDGAGVAICAAHTHLDLPQHSDDDIRRIGGCAVDESGYKVSSMVANPRHHRLSFTLPATPPGSRMPATVVADACLHIKDRLRAVARAIESTEGGLFTVTRLEDGLSEAVLVLANETHTIGSILTRAVYELVPDISYVAYKKQDVPLVLTVRHTGPPARVLRDAVQHLVAIFESIRAQVDAD